jgi:hypothetical protein
MLPLINMVTYLHATGYDQMEHAARYHQFPCLTLFIYRLAEIKPQGLFLHMQQTRNSGAQTDPRDAIVAQLRDLARRGSTMSRLKLKRRYMEFDTKNTALDLTALGGGLGAGVPSLATSASRTSSRSPRSASITSLAARSSRGTSRLNLMRSEAPAMPGLFTSLGTRCWRSSHFHDRT